MNYIIRFKDFADSYLVFSEGNKLHDGSQYDGWFYTDHKNVGQAYKQYVHANMKKAPFIFEDDDAAKEFILDFVDDLISMEPATNITVDSFEVVQFYPAKFGVGVTSHKEISNIIREWKKDAGVTSKVVISLQGSYEHHLTILKIGTNRPGYMVGPKGTLLKSFVDRIVGCENNIYRVDLYETIAFV